ncbi:hypothetical protein [Nocardia sp. 348MFTsu5.1]|uniref:hypothetical protein n=1 Tax=Nocardia sp. 348MFTsu5.1 TaxID=1172185 RepID=UPI00036C41C7|nr:hypothetical protein [Nocardia sp. 348MFTsu5.1]
MNHSGSPEDRQVELNPAFWGPTPTAAESADAEVENQRLKSAAYEAAAANSLTEPQAASTLGISEAEVRRRASGGGLIALPSGQWLYPAWQFDPTTPAALPALRKLLALFGSAVILTEWATSPNADLDNRTPADRLVAGDESEVLRIAAIATGAAW